MPIAAKVEKVPRIAVTAIMEAPSTVAVESRRVPAPCVVFPIIHDRVRAFELVSHFVRFSLSVDTV